MEPKNFSYEEKLNDPARTWEDFLGDIVLQTVKLRKTKKISRQVLACMAGVQESEVNDLENFKYEKVSLPSLAKILLALGVKPNF